MMMRPGEGITERQFYEDALNKAKTGWASTGYGMPINQKMRFDEAAKQLELRHVAGTQWSLVDVGCGTGDFLRYLVEEKAVIPTRYIGLDVMPEMVERTKETIKELFDKHESYRDLDGCRWTAHQGGAEALPSIARVDGVEAYDYVVSIAAYALKDPDKAQDDYLTQLVESIQFMTDYASRAAFVTLFSMWKTHIIGEEMVVDPATMFALLRTKYERVDLIHSYAPFDFSVVVYTEPSEWRQAWEAAQNSEQ